MMSYLQALRQRVGRDPAIYFGLTIIVLVWANVVSQIGSHNRDAAEHDIRNTANLTRTFEESVIRSLKQVESLLLFVTTDAGRLPIDQWGERLRRLPTDPDVTIQVTLADTKGLVAASTIAAKPGPPVDLSDRKHIRVHLDREVQGTFVSQPVLGRLSKKWSVQLTRAIVDQTGTLTGVAVASLDPAYLTRYFTSVDLGPGSALTLVGLDGVVRAGAGLSEAEMGRTIPNFDIGKAVAGGNEGHFVSTLWGSGETLNFWRRVDGFPLIMVASVDLDTVGAATAERSAFLIGAAGIVSVMIALASIAMARAHRSLAATEVRLRQSEQCYRNQSRQLELTLDHMNQGIMMSDVAGRVVVANRKLHRLISGEADHDALDHLLPGMVYETCPALLTDAAPASGIRRLANGRIIRIEAEPVSDGGLVATFDDITEFHQREADLKAAEKSANDANRAKSDFLASMSHEIRTPLNGVIGMSELLLQTRLADEQRQYAETIAASGTALLDVVNDVLDFSKVEAGKMELRPERFDPVIALEEIATLLAVRARQKGLEIVLSIDERMPACLIGDVGRFRQIVINLVGNAVKFTQTGHVAIDVSAQLGASRVALDVVVTDTGPGIAEESLRVIFDAFVQLDPNSTRSCGGTGLGLAISNQLAQLMGGRITVRSQVGSGTSFTLSLQFELAAAAETSAHGPPDFSGRRALVVDDVAPALQAMGGLLRRSRFEVELASDPAQVMSILEASGQRFDLLVIDKEFAGTSGVDFIERVRQLPGYASIAVLQTSNSGVHATDDAETSNGSGQVVHKPVRRANLYEKLAALLPNSAPPPAALDVKATDNDVSAAAPIHTRRLKILAAEDGATNRLVLAGMLKSEAVDLVFAEDGSAAVDAFLAASPDIVLMDLWMPRMHGFDATIHIRAIEAEHRLQRTPIVALTANAMRGDREKCIAAGMDDYLSKPIRKKVLMDMIDRWRDAKVEAPTDLPALYDSHDRRASANAEQDFSDRLTRPVELLDVARVEGMLATLGAEEFDRVVAQFTLDMEGSLNSLREFAETNNVGELQSIVHLVRGCASNLGIERLVQLCDHIRAELLAGRPCRPEDVAACVVAFQETRLRLAGYAGRATPAADLAVTPREPADVA